MRLDWAAISALGAAAGAVVLIGGALVATTRRVRPRWQAMVADVVKARDSINGRDAIHDSITGEEISPEVPGIGVRMSAQERMSRKTTGEIAILIKQQANLTETVQQLAEAQLKQHHLEQRVEDHETRIVKLETAGVERIVARAESAQAWRTVEAAIKAEPNEVDLPNDDVIDVEPDDA